MRSNVFLLSGTLAAWLGLAACSELRHGTPAPLLNLGTQADSATGAIIIGEQDSLWDISKRYRLPVRDIIELNDLSPPYALAIGQRLKLPAPVDYRVREGDTLYSVSGTFGIGMSQLVRVNKLREPYELSPGTMIRISSSYPHKEMHAPSRSTKKNLVARRKVEGIATTMAESKRPDFVWPLHGKIVSSYGAKEDGLFNDGINIAAPRGTPVEAAADGVVAYVGHDLQSYGNLVLIRHGGGTMTAYAHLASVTVKKGMALRKGQSIGIVGSTGSVDTSQLHFEIRQRSKTFDPKKYLG